MGDEKEYNSQHETLRHDSPMASFLRKQAASTGEMTEKEFVDHYERHIRESEGEKRRDGVEPNSGATSGESTLNETTTSAGTRLDTIILKFTTLSEANTEAPSFKIGTSGASIGRSSSNGVSVPSDARLNETEHALITFEVSAVTPIECGRLRRAVASPQEIPSSTTAAWMQTAVFC
jgi:hypothetical protein